MGMRVDEARNERATLAVDNLVRRKRPGELPQSTVDLLKTFATQSVLAIQNAHLFTEIDEKSRQLEIAMALATRPRMLLLDEPMAGMGPEESARLVETLRQLKGGLTILLVEHDMDAVFALADRISVLVYGRVIASGDPAAIRADAAVREAYLGEQDEVGHEVGHG